MAIRFCNPTHLSSTIFPILLPFSLWFSLKRRRMTSIHHCIMKINRRYSKRLLFTSRVAVLSTPLTEVRDDYTISRVLFWGFV